MMSSIRNFERVTLWSPKLRRNRRSDGNAGRVVETEGKSCCLYSGNLVRFLKFTTPMVTSKYLRKTRSLDSRTCSTEHVPYFTLGDLWESFIEWSVYGNGVPLVLQMRDTITQYYVPYLSAMQLYGESLSQRMNIRGSSEESDYDSYRDSNSETSSDYYLERGFRSSYREGFSSEESDSTSSQERLLFEFFDQDTPYNREPLIDKISDLSRSYPELRTLRSCDLSPDSWMSVAWYPIYRIPNGSTLEDLGASFLTYHSLSTTIGGSLISSCDGLKDSPIISLPAFGLASYKFKGSFWSPKGGSDWQVARSLRQAADKWLRLLDVDHPDYQFFLSHGGSCYRRSESY